MWPVCFWEEYLLSGVCGCWFVGSSVEFRGNIYEYITTKFSSYSCSCLGSFLIMPANFYFIVAPYCSKELITVRGQQCSSGTLPLFVLQTEKVLVKLSI